MLSGPGRRMREVECELWREDWGAMRETGQGRFNPRTANLIALVVLGSQVRRRHIHRSNGGKIIFCPLTRSGQRCGTTIGMHRSAVSTGTR